jgi:hypothetical protein
VPIYEPAGSYPFLGQTYHVAGDEEPPAQQGQPTQYEAAQRAMDNMQRQPVTVAPPAAGAPRVSGATPSGGQPGRPPDCPPCPPGGQPGAQPTRTPQPGTQARPPPTAAPRATAVRAAAPATARPGVTVTPQRGQPGVTVTPQARPAPTPGVTARPQSVAARTAAMPYQAQVATAPAVRRTQAPQPGPRPAPTPAPAPGSLTAAGLTPEQEAARRAGVEGMLAATTGEVGAVPAGPAAGIDPARARLAQQLLSRPVPQGASGATTLQPPGTVQPTRTDALPTQPVPGEEQPGVAGSRPAQYIQQSDLYRYMRGG